MNAPPVLYTCKEMASLLRKHVGYLYAMRKAGFIMLAGVASLQEALDWLREHPNFTKRRAWEHRRHFGKKRENKSRS